MGLEAVIWSKSEDDILRRPADVGLYLLIPIVPLQYLSTLEEIDKLALLKTDSGFLPVGALPCIASQTFDFSSNDRSGDGQDPDVEDMLNRFLDLRLGRRDPYLEGVGAGVSTLQTLLRKKRSSNNGVMIGHGDRRS